MEDVEISLRWTLHKLIDHSFHICTNAVMGGNSGWVGLGIESKKVMHGHLTVGSSFLKPTQAWHPYDTDFFHFWYMGTTQWH